MRGYKIKRVHIFELAMRANRTDDRIKNGNNHISGFPIGASGKKRAYRITIRSPFFSKKGFFPHTKYFSIGHSILGKGYNFIRKTLNKNELKQRRIKVQRKPQYQRYNRKTLQALRLKFKEMGIIK